MINDLTVEDNQIELEKWMKHNILTILSSFNSKPNRRFWHVQSLIGALNGTDASGLSD